MREEIITVISAVTGLSIEQLSNKSAYERPWNSLTHVELVIALEDKFQIFFEPEEIANMTSVDLVIEETERKVQ
ncbi:MAG: acyl carrier protein [Clostridiales bacterium]|nr:acyl carrier protein [Clostridiales bacterium]